jgi:DNA-binding transcriptional ArsR family regulator
VLLSGTPIGTTVSAQVDKFVPHGAAKCASNLVVQKKEEILMLVPEVAGSFRATIGALRSLDERSVSFHTFSLPEDRIVRLFLKDLGKRMPETEIREEHIHVQAVINFDRGDGSKSPRRTVP